MAPTPLFLLWHFLVTSNYLGILSSPLSLFPEISLDFWRCFPLCFLGVSRLRFLLSFSAPFGSYGFLNALRAKLLQLRMSDLPVSSVHGILQARILEWVAIPSPGDLPDTGMEPASLLHWQVSPFPLAPSGKQILGEVKILTEELERTCNVKVFFSLSF